MTRGRRTLAAVAGILLFAGFVGLGVWQLQRRAWKLDLIARVDARVHAPVAAPPGPADWPRVSAARDEYRHVQVTGSFQNDQETLVQAVTEKGPGYWVLTPLRTDAGWTVLVNRGFVPPDKKEPSSRPEGLTSGPATVTGLIRMSEPHGGFLRSNEPAASRWYSRDVGAIAQTRGLRNAAPYFIDADATANPGGWPLGGLTVVRFRNSHLSYALTWFGMAGLVAAWGVWAVLEGRRARRRAQGEAGRPGDGD